MKIYYPHEPTTIGKHTFGTVQDPDLSTDPNVKAPALLILEPKIVVPNIQHFIHEFETVLSVFPLIHKRWIQYTMRTPPLWPKLEYIPFSGNNSGTRVNKVISIMGDKYRHRRKNLQAVIKSCKDKNINLDLYGTPGWGLPEYIGTLPFNDKRHTLSRYKYCYCPENSYYPNYLTEKLPEAILAGCLPIVDDLQDPSLYPYIPWEYVSTSLEEAMTKPYDQYLQRVQELAPEIIQLHSTERMLDEVERAIHS